MSSYGEDIIRETFEKFGDAIGVQMQIPNAMIANLGAVLQAQIDLLAELQSAGRLVPTGGMALTAEDVRKFIIAIERHYPEGEAELLTRLRALFPATETAEETVRADGCWNDCGTVDDFKCCGRLVNHPGSHMYFEGKEVRHSWPATPVEPAEVVVRLNEAGRWVSDEFPDWYSLDEWEPEYDEALASGRWQNLAPRFFLAVAAAKRALDPAPAEPAEEETKAEAFDVNALVDQVTQAAWNERKRTKEFYGYDSQDWDELPSSKQQIEYSTIRGALTELQRLGLLMLPAASSPVVPAPTETEWATVKSDGQQQNPTQSDVGNDKI